MIVDCTVLGHSFVSGFAHHLQTMHSSTLSPSDVAFHLGVDNSCKRVHLIGFRGAHISRLYHGHFSDQIQPQLVIIDCGSNELACGQPPLEVASNIVDCAKHLLSYSCVKKVLVCSLLVRTKKTGHFTNEQFAKNVNMCNHYIKVFTSSESKIHYHTHQGFWAVPPGVWSLDGVHPNSAAGRKKYLSSLRRAILSVKSKVPSHS